MNEKYSSSFPKELLLKIDPKYKFQPSIKDPLLFCEEKNEQYIVHPILYPKIIELYEKQVKAFWTSSEISLTKDLDDWKKLNKDEKHFIEQVLCFFVSSDTIVHDNLVTHFYPEVKRFEPKLFYGAQMFIEGIHTETYTLLLKTFISDSNEHLNVLFSSIKENTIIKKKADWVTNWMNSNISFHERLVAFAAVEGIFFSSSFCAIGWLKKQGKFQGLCYANDKISADECLHCVHAYVLLNHLLERPTDWRIQQIIASAVEIETLYCSEILPVKHIGINCDTMVQYVRFVADRLLIMMNVSPIYNQSNPFEWMNLWSISGITSFFEKRVSEYQISPKCDDLKFDENF